ncbi:MAG TPA: hypothetical protein VGQ09_14360 [Chitinophagaceae bacterium]|nr:hypothetical protein [Chitinophagaceae bacterium]
MSYDLYFYKQKGTGLSEVQIADYLTDNLVSVNENGNQWFFENQDTEVYYSFDQNQQEDDLESIELYESFPDFDNTHFSFNLNFMRPSFFGLEAFQFVEQFTNDLNLFVFNPQSASDNPYKPTKNELFENWNNTNLWASIDHFEKLHSAYLPIDKSDEAWEYNFQRKIFQTDLGDGYFVPKVFFFKTKSDNNVVTISTWTQHIPNVFPPADYFLLSREYKKLFRIVKDNVLIDRLSLLKEFGSYLDDFNFKDCKIIHPQNAMKVKDKFNSIKSELKLEEFAERLPIENMYNAKPD